VGYLKDMFKDGKENFAVDPSVVFTAAIKAAADLRFQVLSADPSSGLLTVRSPKAEKRWDGSLSVVIMPTPSGSSVAIHGVVNSGGVIESAMTAGFFPTAQGIAEGAMGVAQTKFLGQLRKCVQQATPKKSAPPTGAPVSVQPPAPAGSPVSAPPPMQTSGSASSDPYADLEKLGALLERNLITPQEFEAKKAEILRRM
jgi:hypothetical protein